MIVIVSLVLSAIAYAEEPDSLRQDRSMFIPEVHINDRAVSLQAELYPEVYANGSAAGDMAWVAANSSELSAFWNNFGDSALVLLARLSGLQWRETGFDMYLLRYFPTSGSAEPLLLPIGGVRQGSLIEAVPVGAVSTFNLIFHLSERMLAQATRPDASGFFFVANHPLMDPTPFRRQQLAMLLALAAGQELLGSDSTSAAYESIFWRRQFAARPLFEQYFKTNWILKPDHPLARWLADEPATSELVLATALPEEPSLERKPRRQFIEGVPLKGEFGFAARMNSSNRLIVEKIDETRLAYLCGLRQGDIINQVNGRRVASQRELIEEILKDFESSGALLQIARGSAKQTIFLRPTKSAPATVTSQEPASDSIRR
ncbi:MAG: PDZ domain-containing protein [Candidatus Zixiibacteriota bacterium]